jgi:ribosomal protein S18 acetylase RimI-like enzyme
VSTRVRAFAERDYVAFTRIWRICEGEDVSVDELRARDARWDPSRFEKVRVVAVDEEDAPLGYGQIYHEPSRFDPRRYFVDLGVDPTRRRHGIGGAM